jgi:O-antigen chain-terminating methyltransferase
VETLAKARAGAAVGSRVPEFADYSRAVRVFARLSARIVLFFAGFITVHQRAVNAALVEFASESAAEIARLRARIAQVAHNLRGPLRAEIGALVQQLHDSNVRLQRSLDEGEARMLEHELRLADADCESAWLRLAEAQHRDELDALRGEGKSRRRAEVSDERAAATDRLYVDLENEFRGPRELIKARLTAYLPTLSTNGLGTADRPILDLGCGRGEWLELLSERGLVCRGVDVSGLSVAHCRELGFDAVAGDALSYLQGQPAESWGMVSAFHVVEHLPFGYMIAMLDEILRVLKAGGVILFETPNPENLVVSANYFHCDPTHLRPLHPYLLAQVAKQRGFIGIDLVRQTESRPDERLAELDPGDALAARLNPIIRLVNRHLAAPPDYALIGQKPW